VLPRAAAERLDPGDARSVRGPETARRTTRARATTVRYSTSRASSAIRGRDAGDEDDAPLRAGHGVGAELSAAISSVIRAAGVLLLTSVWA